MTTLATLTALLLIAAPAPAQEPGEDAMDDEATTAEVESDAGTDTEDTPDGPRSMSGMSILGNEEAPKSLVIIPWKSSEMGDDLDLANSLDAKPEAVDKDVFLRELRFYEIRSGQ